MAFKKRSMYSMYHQVSGLGLFGRLICTGCMEVAPGDTWSGVQGLLCRLSPLKHALLQDIFVDTFAFYVPHRLVWSNWENFIADGPMDTPNYTVPTHTVANPGGTNKIKHLWYNEDVDNTTSNVYSALRLYAYNLIFEEYFRDEEQAAENPNFVSNSGRLVNYKKDYWSNLQAVYGKAQEDHTAPLIGGVEVSAKDILEALARQKVAMKRATYGTRYVDILRSFGINVNYQMLQRPELVGIGRGQFNVTDVVQTATPDTGGSLGDLAGHGISGNRLRLRRKSFPEHGTLMFLVVLRPNMVDEDFTDWFDWPREYDSFYDPGLVPLPAVTVNDTDMVSSWASGAKMGYQPWGEWYRKAMSRTQRGTTDWVGQIGLTGVVVPDTFKKITDGQYSNLFNHTNNEEFQFSAVNKLRVARLLPRQNISTVTGMAG